MRRSFIGILLAAAAIPAFAGDGDYVDKTSVETLVFGVSYHSNRSIDWNEQNYGLGLGIAYHQGVHVDLTVTAGEYEDSYHEPARFFLIGARHIFGEREGAHVTIGGAGGYYYGSRMPGIGFMPVVTAGYDRFDLCITGNPVGIGSKNNSGCRDPQDNKNIDTALIAVFLKIRLATF
jgi:hypothetical protein